MKQIIYSLLLIISASSSIAVTTDSTSKKHGGSWSIKGKVLPWTLMICRGANYTIGVEHGFGKNNAIGVDFAYNDYTFNEEKTDPTTHQDYVGPHLFTVTRGLFVNYRRYLEVDKSALLSRAMSRIFNNNCVPYVSSYLKYGKTDFHYQPGYVTDRVSYDEWEYSGGLLVGVVTGFFDLNVGPFYKQHYITDVLMEGGNKSFHTTVVPNFGLRVGVDLFLFATNNSHQTVVSYICE